MKQADENPEDIVDSLNEKIDKSFQELVFIQPIDTETETGLEFRFEIKPETNNEKLKALLPKKSSDKYFIPFTFLDDMTSSTDDFNPQDSEYAAIAMMILSTAKFKIMIDKTIIPSFDKAYFEGFDDESYLNIPFFDYGNCFCLEVPFTVIFTKSEYKLNKIVLTKNS